MLKFADASVQDNEAIVSIAVTHQASAFLHASKRIRSNKCAVWLAMHVNKAVLWYADRALLQDPELQAFLNTCSL